MSGPYDEHSIGRAQIRQAASAAFGSTCWNCGYTPDKATEYQGDTLGPTGAGAPVSGDASVCFNCGELSIFTGEGVDVRRPTSTERQAYLSDPIVAKAMDDIKRFWDERGGRR